MSTAGRGSVIAPLVRDLRGGGPGQQLDAALALHRMLMEGSPASKAAAAEAMEAAGAIPALVRIVSRSRDDNMLIVAAVSLALLAATAQLIEAIVSAGAVPPLVRLMNSSGNAELQSSAAFALGNLTLVLISGDSAASIADAAAGAIPAAIRHLGSSDARNARKAAELLGNFSFASPSLQPAICSAGGIPALVRCLRRRGSTEDVQGQSMQVLFLLLISGSTERCQALVDAGGISAILELLERPPSPNSEGLAAQVLGCLVEEGHGQAVAAADPSHAAEAALQRCSQRVTTVDEPRLQLEAALRNLATAREAAAAASAAAASTAAAPPSAPQPTNAAAAPAPPRVCSAPGCGVTQGRLNRCAGCGSVRYCSGACQAAHWKEHRRECWRVRRRRRRRPAARRGLPTLECTPPALLPVPACVIDPASDPACPLASSCPSVAEIGSKASKSGTDLPQRTKAAAAGGGQS